MGLWCSCLGCGEGREEGPGMMHGTRGWMGGSLCTFRGGNAACGHSQAAEEDWDTNRSLVLTARGKS